MSSKYLCHSCTSGSPSENFMGERSRQDGLPTNFDISGLSGLIDSFSQILLLIKLHVK